MYTIDILKQEHDEISQFVDRLEEECIAIMNGKEVEIPFFEKSIYFIRTFADDKHHKKEEDILFKYMIENLGAVAEKLIQHGMLVEHQMGRYHVMELEKNIQRYEETKADKEKIQIIGHSMGYVNLLRSHIDKENNAVYPFGEKQLPEELKKIIDDEMKDIYVQDEDKTKEKEELLKELLSY
ncbi:MAG: hemerythrin domain-containing protein [Tissierellia bacterium]|nr:hemerythrin domain-containing protein [Tissierellia bacterium]